MSDVHPFHGMTCQRCDVTAAYCPCDMPSLTAAEWEQVNEWHAALGLVSSPDGDAT